MRRLPVLCAGAVIVFAVLAALVVAVALRWSPVATVSAAGAGNLSLTIPSVSGCPVGSSFTFCNQVPGATTQSVTFIITSAAAVQGVSTTLAATPGLAANFAAGDFALFNNTCAGVNLPVNASCTIGITFSPTKAGLRQATLTVADTNGDSLAFNIEGTGSNLSMAIPAPPACTSPATPAFSYCFEAVGSASGPKAFTLTSGTAITGLNIALAAPSGLSSEFNSLLPDFTITGTTCANTLGALASCAINVAFTPQTAGLRSAALTVTDTQGDALAVQLEGFTSPGVVIGYPAATQVCMASPGFQFCNEPTGGTSALTTLTLTNSSGTQITGVTVPAGTTAPSNTLPDFTVKSTSCTATLAANATCSINVAFTPQAVGLRQGVLTVTDTQGDIGSANLSGIGDDFTLALASNQVNQLTVPQGGTVTFNAQVVPVGAFGANGEKVTFLCPSNVPSNTSCAITPCPATVTAGAPITFQIKFVTSSATSIAPVPTTGCSSYGPPPSSMLLPVGPQANGPRVADILPPDRGGRFPAAPPMALLAVGCAAALFLGAVFSANRKPRRISGRASGARAPYVFAAIALAAVIFTGCHNKKNTTIIGPATTAGTTTMIIQGIALDANGNTLNASRGIQLTLQVVAQ